MAFNDQTADRLRTALGNEPTAREIRMMGGLVFMVDDHMCCGVTGDALMVRLGPEGAEAALAEPHVGPLDIGKSRTPRGFVLVEPAGFKAEEDLAAWVARAVAFVQTLPPK